jgi:hypothetical protein
VTEDPSWRAVGDIGKVGPDTAAMSSRSGDATAGDPDLTGSSPCRTLRATFEEAFGA